MKKETKQENTDKDESVVEIELDEMNKEELIGFILGCHTYNMTPNEYFVHLIDKIVEEEKKSEKSIL